MEKIQKMKKGMSFNECLYAISDGNIGLIALLPDVLKKAAEILQNLSAGYYGVLSLFDGMEIYGDDLAYLYKLCEDDDAELNVNIKLLIIVWSYEIGLMKGNFGKTVPYYASLEAIKKYISNYRLNKASEYPFEKGKKFIEENSRIRF